MSGSGWPALPYEGWKETYATLHMWLQVVGKVALAQAPPINHAWAVAFTVTGRGLDPAKVDRAIKLSAEKYCSASIMIGKTATITHDFEILEPPARPA